MAHFHPPWIHSVRPLLHFRFIALSLTHFDSPQSPKSPISTNSGHGGGDGKKNSVVMSVSEHILHRNVLGELKDENEGVASQDETSES